MHVVLLEPGLVGLDFQHVVVGHGQCLQDLATQYGVG